MAGASVSGASHRRKGTACQDAHRWKEVGRDVLVVAVADGAGSATHSDSGAAVAADCAVDIAALHLRDARPLGEDDWYLLLQTIMRSARDRVLAEAVALKQSPNELATTLLVGVVAGDLVAAGQIGDGAVVIRKRDHSFQAITRPTGQEYVNETTFLTSDCFQQQLQLIVHEVPVTGLCLFTDGLQMLALRMPHGEPHAAFFSPLLRLLAATTARDRAEEQLRGFLRSPQISARADDDLTLVLAVRNDAVLQ